MEASSPKVLPFTRKVLIALGLGLFAVLLAVFFDQTARVLLLFFAAVLFGVFLNGLAETLADHSPLSYRIALAVVSLLVLTFLITMGWLFGPNLATQLDGMMQEIPSTIEQLTEEVRQFGWAQALLSKAPDPEELLTSGSGSDILGKVSGVFSTVLSMLANILIVLVVGLYLAIDPSLYSSNAIRLLPPAKRSRAEDVVHALGKALRHWLVGIFASMTVVGLLTWLGLVLIGLPFAFTLALLAALLSFIPNLGPILSVMPAILVGLMESPTQALWVIALYGAIQTIESYAITPLIQQRAVSLPPALLLMSQVIMGVLFGLIGLFLAAPLTVAVIVVVQMVYVEDVLGEDVPILATSA